MHPVDVRERVRQVNDHESGLIPRHPRSCDVERLAVDPFEDERRLPIHLRRTATSNDRFVLQKHELAKLFVEAVSSSLVEDLERGDLAIVGAREPDLCLPAAPSWPDRLPRSRCHERLW
jgi:hypothetical protein